LNGKERGTLGGQGDQRGLYKNISAASSGIYGSPRPAVLGDALGTVPLDLHGHQNGPRSRIFFSVVDFMFVHHNVLI